jgi:hypothetical protein
MLKPNVKQATVKKDRYKAKQKKESRQETKQKMELNYLHSMHQLNH